MSHRRWTERSKTDDHTENHTCSCHETSGWFRQGAVPFGRAELWGPFIRL